MPTPFKFMKPGDQEYCDAYDTFRRSSSELSYLLPVLHELFAAYPPHAVAADFGAGNGFLAGELFKRFRKVYAVEMNSGMNEQIVANCSNAHILNSDLTEAEIPERVDMATMIHLLYHVPDHEWGGHVLRIANMLRPGGRLAVVLMSRYTATNDMLAHFNAPRIDLAEKIVDAFKRREPTLEFKMSFFCVPGPLVTTTWDDTLKISRFMMSDRCRGAFPRCPSEEEVAAYTREHFWNESAGEGGWDSPPLVAVIERNTLFAS